MRKQRTALWWAERWHLASHHMRMYWEYIALQLILWADVIPFEIVSLEILNHKSLYFIMFYMLELRFTFSEIHFPSDIIVDAKVWVSIYNLQFLNVKYSISGIHFVGQKFESLNSGPKARLMSGSFEMRYFKAQNLRMDIHVLSIHCFDHFFACLIIIIIIIISKDNFSLTFFIAYKIFSFHLNMGSNYILKQFEAS